MYPTYIPISTPANMSSDNYGLFLYHEGWKKIDFAEHVKKLGGVPVLFIPGNGGSYKQVRSLAAESSRVYQAGPLEPTFYQGAICLAVEDGKSLLLEDLDGFELPSVYSRTLDWFAIDLEGGHSAMDGRILEEHTEYVVYAIHRVWSKLASLDGIVPSTRGFMISSSSMKNVWLSTDHQSILWCNQLVVQMSHTLLSLINPEIGHPFPSARKKLVVFTKMLQSGIPQSLNWKRHMRTYWASKDLPIKDANVAAGSQPQGSSFCAPSAHLKNDGFEKDLYIRSTSVTVLAMDGMRRWMDIKNLGSDGKAHFIFVTNLTPCSGVRLHLWPEKCKSPLKDEMPAKRILEVTSKMVMIPAGPAPRQIEPGSQTEQAPPSAMLLLNPGEMHGFRFLTISVAPSSVGHLQLFLWLLGNSILPRMDKENSLLCCCFALAMFTKKCF